MALAMGREMRTQRDLREATWHLRLSVVAYRHFNHLIQISLWIYLEIKKFLYLEIKISLTISWVIT